MGKTSNSITVQSKQGAGVVPKSYIALDPRQEKFIELYLNPDSSSFGNCLQSALASGYSLETARNLLHNKPKWLSEKLGQLKIFEPEILLYKLTGIINDDNEQTHNKLRAIDMMMKHYQMFGQPVQNNLNVINIESVLG